MAYSTLQREPSSFDPAIHLHSEPGDLQLPTPSNSDDLEALNYVHTEAIAKKNELGVVIQHRAWKLADVFRSEDDYHSGIQNIVKLTGEWHAKRIRNTMRQGFKTDQFLPFQF